jgi:hypothetical protein
VTTRNRQVMKEVWQPVRGYEGLYEVSDQGRVRSLPSQKWNGAAWTKKPGCIRKTSIGAHGYPAVDLKHNGHRKTFTVHTLVLTAFVGPRPTGQECRHLNGNRADSRLCNLAWGTPSENDQDRKRHGTFIQGEMHGNARLTEHDVRLIRSMRGTQAAIAKRFAVSPSLVSMIKAGQRWAHVQ